MSLTKVFNTIPTKEHFQNIRWKWVYSSENSLKPGRKCLPENVLWSGFCDPDIRNRLTVYEKGKLSIDTAVGRITCYSGTTYPTGIHYGTKNDENLRIVPVLVADIVAFGEQSNEQVGVARMCYFLTEKEYEYLSTEHKPIKIGSTIELQEPELVPL